MGEQGVTAALDIIRKELDTTMALCGLRDIKDVDERILVGGREGAVKRLRRHLTRNRGGVARPRDLHSADAQPLRKASISWLRRSLCVSERPCGAPS